MMAFLKNLQTFFISIVFLSLTLLPAVGHAIKVTGQLIKKDNHYQLRLLSGQEIYLDIQNRYLAELETLSMSYLNGLKEEVDSKGLPYDYPDYYLTFDGEFDKENFKVKESPQISTGHEEIRGILEKSNDQFFINEKKVFFSPSQKVNGTSFNQESIESFVGKNVHALVLLEKGSKKITAIVPSDLYSARDDIEAGISFLNVDKDSLKSAQGEVAYQEYDLSKGYYVPRKKNISLFEMPSASLKSKAYDFAQNLIYQDGVSRSQLSFRETLLKKKNYKPKEGDTGLIITLSGRQGDDTGALGGHFAAGSVIVNKSLDLDIDIWNFYNVPNEKMILSGHNNYLDYFGNITAGQNNYRPTYSIILYGVTPKVLKEIKDELGRVFTGVRVKGSPFGIDFNCTTTTVQALRNVGFYGKRYNGALPNIAKKTAAAGIYTAGSIYPVIAGAFGANIKKIKKTKKDLEYLLWNDPNKYLPRAAFNGYLSNIEKIANQFNIQKVDYIFHAQTPSNRPVGGAPYGGLWAVKTGRDLSMSVQVDTEEDKKRVNDKVQELMGN